jgi:membrane protein YqaA with SNARE-associated domain
MPPRTRSQSAADEKARKARQNKLSEELRLERKKLTLLRRPLSVLYHFSIVFARFIKWIVMYLIQHDATRFLLLPLVIGWLVASNVEGDHHQYLDEFNKNIEFIVWWIGLGVLSSVGLGTGMHSGILFLFPHIFLVVQGAETCKSLDFDTRNHIWFRSFEADCSNIPDQSTVTFFAIFRKVIVPCMLWGAGTAAGEIPPYALSRAAKLAGQRNEEFEEITESKSSYNLMNHMKDWMIDFLQKHGFWGVLLMSAWPNVAFDLCGICCGHFLMPFWTFFGATLIGKAIIKVNLQAAFFITIFTDAHLKQVEHFIAGIFPSSWKLEQKVSEFLLECREKFHSAHSQASIEHTTGGGKEKSSLISQAGTFVMISFLAYFAISCIEQFAQQHAAEEDEEKIKKIA